ncbi:MAG: hypothetical protein KIT57_07015 [Blastocatellales bacterium]|nr:hypothetical protein [Blastocatellales bacterium]
MNAAELEIGAIRSERQSGHWRIVADVAGQPIWFESADPVLSCVTEGFGSAMLIPALHEARRLRLPGSVSREWRQNIARLLPVLSEWWQYPELAPLSLSDEAANETKAAGASGQAALCFSGGVDSFYSLLRGSADPRLLVFVHGYDMKLEDEARFSAFIPTLEAAASATGSRAIIVRTNLREHPAFNVCSWERTHGGALAGVCHLLTGSIDRMYISATYVLDDERPWGSHARIDHLWSSDRLRVAQCGSEIWRHDKLRAILDEPLVRDHLRVCWENRTPSGNCSRCDKCIMTMIVLAQAGRLERFGVFDAGDPSRHDAELAARLDRLAQTVYVRTYAILRRDGLGRKLDRAVGRLLDRSPAARARNGFLSFWRRW